jgi:hypothetical protein
MCRYILHGGLHRREGEMRPEQSGAGTEGFALAASAAAARSAAREPPPPAMQPATKRRFPCEENPCAIPRQARTGHDRRFHPQTGKPPNWKSTAAEERDEKSREDRLFHRSRHAVQTKCRRDAPSARE